MHACIQWGIIQAFKTGKSLSRFWCKQFVPLLINTMCLAEKQTPILLYLGWPIRVSCDPTVPKAKVNAIRYTTDADPLDMRIIFYTCKLFLLEPWLAFVALSNPGMAIHQYLFHNQIREWHNALTANILGTTDVKLDVLLTSRYFFMPVYAYFLHWYV
jgi:hypothetical protein